MENSYTKETKFKTEPIFMAERDYKETEKYDIVNGCINQIEWLKRQLDYQIFSMRKKLRYNIKKGDIFEIDWGYNINAEFSNRHYGVVLVDSNEYNPLVIVCPLKTNHKGAHPRSDINLGTVEGLKEGAQTLAVINQIRAVDKIRLYTKQVINYNLEEEVNLKMEEEKVNKILKCYHLLLENKPFWLVN